MVGRKPPTGRRAAKIARAGLKKPARSLAAPVEALPPPPAAPLPPTAEVLGVAGHRSGVATAPRKWTAEQRAAKRAKLADTPEAEQGDGGGAGDGAGDGGAGDGAAGEAAAGEAAADGSLPSPSKPTVTRKKPFVAPPPGAGKSKHAVARREKSAAAAAIPPPRPPAQRFKPSAAHGSHFGHGATGVVNDEWQTTREALAELLPCLATSAGGDVAQRTVWMPFWYDGVCESHMRALGVDNVIHENADFFERAKDAVFLDGVDVIVDNPPYTSAEVKEAVVGALLATGKPWCCLFPSSILFSTHFRATLDASKLQVILPRRLKVCKTNGPAVPFKQMIWVAYGLELQRDLYIVGE